ncbi:hypothetical protein BpHYR1_042597 [Brachionus plicatilis]|uniref:Uncharacterized protein n=1 Tax=Brachionus plicatilis TaxID=10195 RepID=A0A3M7QKD0_BRAPC|nr:hypothetical protein BpHYR1_042597 [Brachionus plicatilis]
MYKLVLNCNLFISVKSLEFTGNAERPVKTMSKCWDPYKRPLNRRKFSETVTVSAFAGQLFGDRPFGRPAWRPNFWTAKINGQKYTVGQKSGQLFGGRPFGRPAWRPNLWTAKINGQKYTGGQKSENKIEN